MKPAWDQLIGEYSDSRQAGIYDVDCTADGKDLCEEVGVEGYPTIKYGDPIDKNALKDYEGGRDFESLKKFTEETLAPLCRPSNMDACSDEERTMLEGFLKRSASDLLAEADKISKRAGAKQKQIEKRISTFKAKFVEFLEVEFEHSKSTPKKGEEKQHEDKTANIKSTREKMEAERDAIKEEADELKAEVKASGMKLMKLAAKANNDKTDL